VKRVTRLAEGGGEGGDLVTNIAGGCLCGAVRYESEAEPVLTALCHCRDCQKQTSSAFSVLVALPKGSLRTEGRALASVETVGENTGLPTTRRFCSGCGSAIVSDVGATPDLEWLKAGTLDDASWLRPQMHMWSSRAQPWVALEEDIPAYERNPPLGG
jgi:hypothetical protein